MTTHRSRKTPPDAVTVREATPDEVAYSDGYRQGQQAGRVAEQRRAEAYARHDAQRAREASNAMNGLLLGLIVATAVGLLIGAIAYVTRTDNPAEPLAPAETEQIPENTTIIERTREVVPVPSEIETPDVNVDIVAPEPAAPEAPAAEVGAPSEPAPAAE